MLKTRIEQFIAYFSATMGQALPLDLRWKTSRRIVSRITHFEGQVIALFHGLPAGISRAL
jgi:hypothetical protein